MKKNITILSLVLLLNGCATTTSIQEKTNTIVDDKFGNKVIFPSGADAENCPEFPLFKGKSMGDLYKFIVEDVAKKYQECSDRLKTNQNFIEIYKNEENKKNSVK